MFTDKYEEYLVSRETRKIDAEIEKLIAENVFDHDPFEILDGSLNEKKELKNWGLQELYRFPNNYGCSCVFGRCSCGAYAEIAIIHWTNNDDYELDYGTSITEGIIDTNSKEELEKILKKVKNL